MLATLARRSLSKLADAYRWRRGYAPLPWGIDFLLTDACNLRCSYCPIWGDDAVVPSPARFMDVAAARAFLAGVAGFRPMIRLFGGEPFVHPGWREIVAAARGEGLHVTAVTNGVRLAKDAEDVVGLGMLAVGVSLDTTRPVNDAARGARTLDAVREGLTRLAEVKARRGSDTPRVEIYTTVHEGTFEHLVAWAEELASWDVAEVAKLRLQHLIFNSPRQLADSQRMLREAVGTAELFRHEERSFTRATLPAIDVGVLQEQLTALAERDHPFEIEPHPRLDVAQMARYYGEAEFVRSSNKACTTMESYAFVDPRGRLYPCMTLDMGNVFERPFVEVWNGPRFRAFRRLIRREKRLPFCQRCPDG